MEVLGVVVFWLNVVILLFISNKLRKMMALEQQFKQIQNNIAVLVREHSQVVNTILEDLESKIEEAKETMDMLKETKTKEEKKAGLPPGTPKPMNVSSKIIYLRQQGLSVQEIAEQLKLPQGEISLKINLHEMIKQNKISNFT